MDKWLGLSQSRRQSSRLRGAKRLLGEPKFDIKHKTAEKSKLVDWEGQAHLALFSAGPGPSSSSAASTVQFM